MCICITVKKLGEFLDSIGDVRPCSNGQINEAANEGLIW